MRFVSPGLSSTVKRPLPRQRGGREPLAGIAALRITGTPGSSDDREVAIHRRPAGRDPPDCAGGRKPQVAVRSDRHRLGEPGAEVGHRARGRDPPDLRAAELREPEVAVGPGSNRRRLRLPPGQRELGDRPARGDAPNPPARLLGEPEGTVGSGDDPRRAAAGCRKRERRDRPGRGDPPDPVAAPDAREPQRAVGTGRDVGRATGRKRELGHGTRRRDATDTTGGLLGEPQRAVGTGRDGVRPAVGAQTPGTR